MRLTLLFLLCLFSFFSVDATEKKTTPKFLNVGIGVYDIIHDPHNVLLQLEYRSFLKKCKYIRPLIGIMGTDKATVYIYGGIAGDIFLGNSSFVLTPSFAPGVYFKGKGKDLGYPLEFRSSMELAYILPNEGRIGAQFYHISNGSTGDKNPGSESLVFFYAIPL